MGLLVGMALYPIISPSLRHRSIVLALRVGAAALVVVLFVVLIRNFYTSNPYAGMCTTSRHRRKRIADPLACSLFMVPISVLHPDVLQQLLQGVSLPRTFVVDTS